MRPRTGRLPGDFASSSVQAPCPTASLSAYELRSSWPSGCNCTPAYTYTYTFRYVLCFGIGIHSYCHLPFLWTPESSMHTPVYTPALCFRVPLQLYLYIQISCLLIPSVLYVHLAVEQTKRLVSLSATGLSLFCVILDASRR